MPKEWHKDGHSILMEDGQYVVLHPEACTEREQVSGAVTRLSYTCPLGHELIHAGETLDHYDGLVPLEKLTIDHRPVPIEWWHESVHHYNPLQGVDEWEAEWGWRLLSDS